jgi:hypothetical protein
MSTLSEGRCSHQTFWSDARDFIVSDTEARAVSVDSNAIVEAAVYDENALADELGR